MLLHHSSQAARNAESHGSCGIKTGSDIHKMVLMGSKLVKDSLSLTSQQLSRVASVAGGGGGLDPWEDPGHAGVDARVVGHGAAVAPGDDADQSVAAVDLCKII